MPSSIEERAIGTWQEWAGGCRPWAPPVGPLCVVAPHPDDETLGAGGLMFDCRRRGQPVTVLSVTDGEASHPDFPELAAVRRRELARALRILGGEAVGGETIRIERLALPDGDVRSALDRVRSAVRALAPEVVLVAPYEHDGHPDHEAVGIACAEIAAECGRSLVRYAIWAWLHGTPASLRRLSWRRLDLDADTVHAKSAALACFASQLSAARGAPIVPPALLAFFGSPYEMFVA